MASRLKPGRKVKKQKRKVRAFGSKLKQVIVAHCRKSEKERERQTDRQTDRDREQETYFVQLMLVKKERRGREGGERGRERNLNLFCTTDVREGERQRERQR